MCKQSVVVGGWTGKFGVPHIPATELQLLKPLDYVVDATFVCLWLSFFVEQLSSPFVYWFRL